MAYHNPEIVRVVDINVLIQTFNHRQIKQMKTNEAKILNSVTSHCKLASGFVNCICNISHCGAQAAVNVM